MLETVSQWSSNKRNPDDVDPLPPLLRFGRSIFLIESILHVTMLFYSVAYQFDEICHKQITHKKRIQLSEPLNYLLWPINFVTISLAT